MKIKQLLTFVLSVLCYVSACAQGDDDKPYVTKNFNGSSLKELQVETSGGSISVLGGQSDGFKVEMYIRSNGWNGNKELSKEEIEDRLERFTTEIARHEADVANLDRQLLEYAPALRARRSWEHENADDRTRLTAIERTIDLTERLDQVVVRSLDRGVQASRGIELGL